MFLLKLQCEPQAVENWLTLTDPQSKRNPTKVGLSATAAEV
ncbi:hypothetical protein NIES2104_37990 [Leptolyngbya sp. NIES-2104]|nr:hypothetical protein NIES2104_37990 [Leptolyngbya sp. NIES-2104]